MLRFIGIAQLIAALLAVAPARAQVSSDTTAPAPGGWNTPAPSGTTLSSPRQSPDQQPNAPTRPASQTVATTIPPAATSTTAGFPFAGGTLYSGLTVGTFYDDNVFATNTNRMSDWAVFARPEFDWVKQGGNYTAAIDGFLEGRDYTRFSSEDQLNGSIGAGFTVMPDNNTQIVGNARYIHGHLDRGASDTVITLPGGTSELITTLFDHPVAYDEGVESLALNKRYGNWWSSVGVAGLEINYQNATIGSLAGVTPLTGSTVDLSYADGNVITGNARVGYVFMPLTSVFVETAANSRGWDVDYFDSNGYRAVAGLLFDQGPGARLKGEVWGGYMSQLYEGGTLQNISTWTYGVGVTAVLTDRLTAVVEGRREAKEAALGLATLPSGMLGASLTTCSLDVAVCVSTIESEVGARLDYQIIPKVIIGGGVTYLRDEYQGAVAFGRVDSTLSPLASLKYLVTPNITLAFDYRNIQYSTTGGTAPAPFTNVSSLPYTRNVYMISANARW